MENTYPTKKKCYDSAETGKRIQQFRKDQGMTQEQFAARINIGDRHLRKIESGEKGPSLEILVEISAQFGLSLDYIIMGKQPQNDLKHSLQTMIKDLSLLVEGL